MSHFAVLVVTPNGTAEEIDKALLPYHEFECTGLNNEFIQDIDQTDEAHAQWVEECDVYRAPDGTIYSPFKTPDSWWREPTPEEVALIAARKPLSDPLPFETRSLNGVRQVKQIPEDVERVRATIQVREEAEGKTFTSWASEWYGAEIVPFGEEPDVEGENAKHKYGYILVDEAGNLLKLVKRTNPDRKWDWYQIGGRYSGRLQLKPGATGAVGKRSWTNADADISGCDSARKQDIDLEAIRAENVKARQEAVRNAYDKIIAKNPELDDEGVTNLWRDYKLVLSAARELVEKGEVANVLEAFNANPEWKALQAKINPLGGYYFGPGVPENEDNPLEWAKDAPSLTTWAFLGMDRVWREKGEMGWFGMSSGDMEEKDWEKVTSELIAQVPDDHFITVVDCHI